MSKKPNESQRFELGDGPSGMARGRVFHRPELAKTMGDELLGRDHLSMAGHSGMFLAAPRRTGKSTFIMSDLAPYLESQGALVIYVDLWAEKYRDPCDVLVDRIQSCLREQALQWAPLSVRRALKSAQTLRGAEIKAKIADFEAEFGFQIEKVGKQDGATLSTALRSLHAALNGVGDARGAPSRSICLIIDEAQHALMSEAGRNALFALKAARDALNIGRDIPGLCLLATGSLRPKLAQMVNSKREPFYGAVMSRLEHLGPDYVDSAVRAAFGHRLDEASMPKQSQALEAFAMVGFRPEEFLQHVLRPALAHPEPDIGKAMLELASMRSRTLGQDYVEFMSSLPPIQHALMVLLAKYGANLEPFGEESLFAIKKMTGHEFSKSAVQAALNKLSFGENPIIWKSARGAYEIDDEVFSRYLTDLAGEAFDMQIIGRNDVASIQDQSDLNDDGGELDFVRDV